MDIIAGFIELIAAWLVGNKNRLGFVLFILSGIIWSEVAIRTHIYGLLIVCVPMIFINIRNYIKWGDKKMSDKNYDINSEEELKRHCADSEEIAEQYKSACEQFAGAKLRLDSLLVKSWAAEEIKSSTAYEKALPMVAEKNAKAKADYEIYVKSELLIKALEKVLETRSQSVMLHMSLMKNRTLQGASQ